jgi:ribosomal protein S18 acetylase RimI-like enzyme
LTGGAGETAVTIRRAGPDDLEAVAALHWRSWQATYGPLMSLAERALLTLDERREAWRPALRGDPPLTVMLIAEPAAGLAAGGALAGFVSSVAAADDRGTGGSIPALHVDPLLHGRGVGRRLLQAALDELRAAGCRSVSLTVLSANLGARGFYEHLGWTLVGAPLRERMEGLDQLPEVELVRYRLEL